MLFASALVALFPLLLPAQHGGLPAPVLRQGQTMIYQLDFNASRDTHTESRISRAPTAPGDQLRALCLLQVEVADENSSGFHLKTYISEKTDSFAPPNAASPAGEAGPDKLVELFLVRDGSVSQVKGLDQLTVAQQFAWNTWLSQFTSTFTFPNSNLQQGRKWEREEPETTPSPLTRLVWSKKYQYVRNEPCGPPDSAAHDSCAVILVHAQLHQKSSSTNLTPEDFKLRGLVTGGTANGANETILFIKLATGLLFRSSEEAQQAMDASIALADGSNKVRYVMAAKSRSQIQLLSDSSRQAP